MIGSSSRMLALLSLLQARRDWPGQLLAERLDVSARTVRRDVDRLRELGYRITATKGPDGGYRLAAGSELPPLLFDDEQAVAIAVALQSMPASGIDLDEGAARALATVRQVMPSRLRHRVDGIRFLGTQNPTRVNSAVLEAVVMAARDHHVLRFDYRTNSHANSGDRPPRRTEPHAVVAREGRWYLLAWDLDTGDWRTFRLDRMTPQIPSGPTFTPRDLPAADAQTYLAARAKGSETEDRWPCVGSLAIALPAHEVEPWIGADGSVEAIDTGSCRVTVGSWSWVGILASIARFDAPFTVLAPEELVAAAHQVAERFAAVTTATAEEKPTQVSPVD